MADFIPASQVDSNYYNPNRFVNRKVINSGFALPQAFLASYQKLMQDAVRNSFVDFAKYPGLSRPNLPLYLTSQFDSFDLLGCAHIGSYPVTKRFVINAGTAYNAYGDRLFRPYRSVVDLAFSSAQDANGYAYLCMRKLNDYQPIDYMEHPVTGIPSPTKIITDVEFYLSDSYEVALEDPLLTYPPLDANGLINGIVIAKIFTSSVTAPIMTGFKTNLLAVKDGSPVDIAGFLKNVPSTID